MRYPDNCSPRKIVPRLGLGFGSRLGLTLGLRGNQTIAPEENSPRLELGFRLGLVLGLGSNFSQGQLSTSCDYVEMLKKSFLSYI